MKKGIVVLNEQHSLKDDQKRVLEERFPEGYELYAVPAEGWSLDQMSEVQGELMQRLDDHDLVFASPVPALMLSLASEYFYIWGRSDGLSCGGNIIVLHNDRREKKELPNGKVISVVAEEGWQLVSSLR